jgi:predicted ATPase
MIEEFKVKNFKNLDIKNPISLKKVNILIGANGSGKSNFIDAIWFFKDLIEKGLIETIYHRKFKEILNVYSNENKINLSIFLNTETGHPSLNYDLELLIPEDEDKLPFILREKLSYSKSTDPSKEPFKFISCRLGKCEFPVLLKNKKIISQTAEVSPHETIFKQEEDIFTKFFMENKFIPKFFNVIKNLKGYVDTWRHFSMSDINLSDLKKPFKLTGKKDRLLTDVSNLGEFLFDKMYSEEWNIFLDRLKDYFRQSVDFEFQRLGEYIHIWPKLSERRFSFPSLSDGQIRIIILLSIFYLDKTSKLIFIDEPELNLHPSWLRMLRNDIFNCEKQIVLSTHSADLLDTFTDDFKENLVNVLVFENGKVKQLEFNEILKYEFDKGYELGDLYRMGDPLIGGWPF